uniref:Peptidase S1 domain-containing protein n=1 Tax=Sphenodon punctatus TaxID=8508 RepID=A0A8D0GR65_SPHPU
MHTWHILMSLLSRILNFPWITIRNQTSHPWYLRRGILQTNLFAWFTIMRGRGGGTESALSYPQLVRIHPCTEKFFLFWKVIGLRYSSLFTGCGTRVNKVPASTLERISGGQYAESGDWPWQASLQQNGVHRCGATLISNTWLVTAAHCFRRANSPRAWTASFGTSLRSAKKKRNIYRIIVHENYANNILSHDYDIAVVQLTPSVPFTNDVHRVCLPEASQDFPENTSCYVTGWGALRDDGSSVNDLRQTEVKIIGNEICNRPEVYNGVIRPGMLCAGYLEGGRDACQGDSGGPLVTPDSRGLWYLVGIVSWGDECAKRNKPGVYTRVTAYRDWIAEKTGL